MPDKKQLGIIQLEDRIAELEAEVRRATAIKEVMEASMKPVEQVFIPRDLVAQNSKLYQFVTRVRMPSQSTDMVQGDGRMMNLRATTQKDLDSKILFGCGIDEPVGIANASITITINGRLSIDNLASMAECSLLPSTAFWVVNSEYIAEFTNLIKAYDRLAFSIICLEPITTYGHKFSVGLFSLQYYILGEYEAGGAIMVDGQPILQYPITPESYTRTQRFSPFVILNDEDG